MEDFSIRLDDQSKSGESLNFGPLFIGLAAILWTSDFFFRSDLTKLVDSSFIVMYEHILITIVILPLFFKYVGIFNELNWKEWLAIILIGGGASALATVLLTEGYSLGFFPYGPVVALTQQIQPVVAIGLAHLLLKEKLPNYYYLLSVFAIIGVFLLYWPTVKLLEFGSVQDSKGLLAAIYGLSAALLWGSGTVLGRYLMNHSEHNLEYIQVTVFRFVIGMIFLVAYNLIFESFKDNVNVLSDAKGLSMLVYIALIPGLLSLVLYYYGLRTTHASVATLFELAFPLTFLLLIPFITEQYYETIQWYGAALLILASTVLSYLYGKETAKVQMKPQTN